MWARLQRIEPIYLISLGLTIAVTWQQGADLTFIHIIGHLLFLQTCHESLFSLMKGNPPLWSLGNEFQFYCLFALTLTLKKPYLVYVWTVSSLIALLFVEVNCFGKGCVWGEGFITDTLSLSPAWLVGFFLVFFKTNFFFSWKQVFFIFALIPTMVVTHLENVVNYRPLTFLILALMAAPLIHTCAQPNLFEQKSAYKMSWFPIGIIYILIMLGLLFSDNVGHRGKLIYGLLPPLIICLVKVIFFLRLNKVLNHSVLRQLALTSGKCSYALYVIHWPLMYYFKNAFPQGKLQLFLMFLTPIVAAFFLEYQFQPSAVLFMKRLKVLIEIKTN